MKGSEGGDNGKVTKACKSQSYFGCETAKGPKDDDGGERTDDKDVGIDDVIVGPDTDDASDDATDGQIDDQPDGGLDDATDDQRDEGVDDSTDGATDDQTDDGADDTTDEGMDDETDDVSDDTLDDGTDDGVDDGTDDGAVTDDTTDDGTDEAIDDATNDNDDYNDDYDQDDIAVDDDSVDDALIAMDDDTTGKDDAPATPLVCGCNECTSQVLDTLAGAFSCRQRIDYLQTDEGGLFSEEDACEMIGNAHPDECAPCNPLFCDGRVPTFCGCTGCTVEVWNAMAGTFSCGARISYLQTTDGGLKSEADSCEEIALAFGACGACNSKTCT